MNIKNYAIIPNGRYSRPKKTEYTRLKVEKIEPVYNAFIDSENSKPRIIPKKFKEVII